MLNLYLFGWGATVCLGNVYSNLIAWDIDFECSWSEKFIEIGFWTPYKFLIISAGKDNRP